MVFYNIGDGSFRNCVSQLVPSIFRFVFVLYKFVILQDTDSLMNEPSDWEKFAMEEYDILVAEEQASEQQDNV